MRLKFFSLKKDSSTVQTFIIFNKCVKLTTFFWWKVNGNTNGKFLITGQLLTNQFGNSFRHLQARLDPFRFHYCLKWIPLNNLTFTISSFSQIIIQIWPKGSHLRLLRSKRLNVFPSPLNVLRLKPQDQKEGIRIILSDIGPVTGRENF